MSNPAAMMPEEWSGCLDTVKFSVLLYCCGRKNPDEAVEVLKHHYRLERAPSGTLRGKPLRKAQ
jgi:hypothetical protein